MAGSASTAEQTLLNQVLDPAKMDPSGRKPCLKGTRRKFIVPILHWVHDVSSDTNVHWLSGDAGLGKSAIANSVADELPGLAVAYLFFDRNDPTSSHPNLVIRTIAYKLAINNSVIRVPILEAIEQNPKITTESLVTQYMKLLYEPLTSCRATLGSPLLVILDALDECGDDTTRRVLVNIIAKSFTSLPSPIKFLITSRAELDIVEPLMTSPNINRINRVELLASESTMDVLYFLYDAMRRIRETRPSSRLPYNWPGTPTMLKLSRYTEGVFLLASTVVSFVENSFKPECALHYLLVSNSASSIERLDCLFSTVLESVGDWKDARFVEEFRAIVGAVVAGQAPMTVLVFDQLLGLKRSSSAIILSFRFLLRYSETQPIRTLHASVSDYLTDSKRCGSKPWFINISDQHRFLVGYCLRLMKEQLRFNICGLETSHLPNEDVPDLHERVETCIPESLVYACQHFATHLHLSNIKPSDFDVHADIDSFMSSRLLFWLEVLSLVGEDKVAMPVMKILEQWYRNNNEGLADLAYEVVKFMTVFRGIISQSTPHLYISAVPMWRESSHIRRMYGHKLREIVRTKNGSIDLMPSLQNVMRGHTDSVTSVGFSPDGKRVVSGSFDNTVRIWNAETGSVVAGPFEGHTDRVLSVGFSPDGTRVVSGSLDNTLRVWDAEIGSVVAGPFEGHTHWVMSVGFSPDGRRVVSGSLDNTVRIWDAESGSVVVGPFEGHTGWVTCVAFSPDGKRVVSGSEDKTVRIWDTETGYLVGGPFEGHTDPLTSVGFSPDGKLVVCGSEDTTVWIWNTETGFLVAWPFEGHTNGVTSVGFSPDGKRVVSGSKDNTLRIWEAMTGSVVAGPFEGHTDQVTSVGFSPDGKRVVSGSWDKTVRTWDAETGSVVTGTFEAHTYWVTSVGFSPDGKHIVSGSRDKTVRIWDAETGSVVSGPFKGHTRWVTSVGFSPDGKHVVSGSDDTTVRIWSAKTGLVVGGPFKGHTGWVTSVEFSPDGKRVVSGSADETVRIWDVKKGSIVGRPFEGHTARVRSVGFSPDGRRVVSGSEDRTVRIWDVETGFAVAGPFEGHTHSVVSADFSPDGKRVVSGSSDNTVRIWDAETGSIVAGPLEGHTYWVTSVEFSPDGKRVVSGSEDNTVRIWDAETGSVAAGPFEGHTDKVRSVGFSRDGKYVVSGSADQTIRIWDTETGSVLAGHFEGRRSVEFSPDREHIISHSRDKGKIGSAMHLKGLVSFIRSARFSPREKRVVTHDPHPASSSHLPDSQPAFHDACSWRLHDDGWLRSASGSLILWIPHYYPRSGLCLPPTTVVIGVHRIQFDLSFVHGERWTECFDTNLQTSL